MRVFTHSFFMETEYYQNHDTPSRIHSLYRALKKFPVTEIEGDGKEAALRVHGKEYVDFISYGAEHAPDEFSTYPVIASKEMVFSEPESYEGRHSLWFFDEQTKADKESSRGALLGAAGAYMAACAVREGQEKNAWLLVRPPGHHAFPSRGGGLCFFNNGAIAASVLKEKGRVALLDLDQEHGNGTQRVFYEDPQVYTLSVHSEKWPLLSGCESERGAGAGKGYNRNFPLKEGAGSCEFREALLKAVKDIREFRPDFLVLALGFDGHKNDSLPWVELEAEDYAYAARELSLLNLPCVITQEGGYNPISNTACIRAFLKNWMSHP